MMTVLAALLTAIVAACGPAADPVSVNTRDDQSVRSRPSNSAKEGEPDSISGSCDIVAIDGRPPARTAASPTRPTLDFRGAAYGGSTGCNSITGGFVLHGGRLYTHPGPTTQMGCAALTSQEERIYALLREAPFVRTSHAAVHLSGGGGGGMLLRRATRPLPATVEVRPLPTDFTGEIITVNGRQLRDVVGDPAARIAMSTRSLRFDIGCGQITALIKRAKGDVSLMVGPHGKSSTGCTGDLLASHLLLTRLSNGPIVGFVDHNGDGLIAGDGIWLTARSR